MVAATSTRIDQPCLQDVCNNFLESHRISAELSIRMKKFVVSCHQQTWLESKLAEAGVAWWSQRGSQK